MTSEPLSVFATCENSHGNDLGVKTKSVWRSCFLFVLLVSILRLVIWPVRNSCNSDITGRTAATADTVHRAISVKAGRFKFPGPDELRRGCAE